MIGMLQSIAVVKDAFRDVSSPGWRDELQLASVRPSTWLATLASALADLNVAAQAALEEHQGLGFRLDWSAEGSNAGVYADAVDRASRSVNSSEEHTSAYFHDHPAHDDHRGEAHLHHAIGH